MLRPVSSSAITNALGAGTGIDTGALIASLTEATRAPQQAAIDRRTELNSTRISTIASVSSAIDSFASSLQSLIDGGSLRKTTSVSDPTVVSASAIAGARPNATSARLTVDAVASGQTLTSGYRTSASDPVGTGDFTITTGAGSFTVTIDGTNNSLSGLAAAITGAGSGVTAAVVSDADGARLVLRGAAGSANAYTLSTTSTDGLQDFAFGPGVTSAMTQAQPAADALVTVDGVQTRHSSNVIRGLVDGAEINLLRANPGATVTVSLTTPTTNLQNSIVDFVDAYNQVEAQLDAALSAVNGPLRGNEAMVSLRRALAKLPTAQLVTPGNGPSTLSEVGVRTNRDGSLSVDAVRLAKILADDPNGVEALFNPTQFSNSTDIEIKSAPSRVKPGTYTLTNLVAPNGTTPASGLINGQPAIAIGRNLVAPSGSPALGLIVAVNADVASATVTIEPGLGGALDSIRDALRSSTGPLAATRRRLAAESAAITEAQDKLDVRLARYTEQLTRSYASVDSRVAAARATQSYLTQQIAIWTNANS